MIVDAPVRRRTIGEIGFQPGQCPALDASYQKCLLNGNEVPCSYIRECDPYTGAVHFEYALPYGTSNVNIWDIAGNQAFWMGPNPMPETQPVFPEYVSEAVTFGNSQILNAPSVPVVIANKTPTPTPVQSVEPRLTLTPPVTTTPTSSNTTPTVTPGTAVQTTSPSSPAQPAIPASNSLTEAASRVWKQITAGDAATAAAPGATQATYTAAAWYEKFPWWVWVVLAAGGAYALSKIERKQ